jgi:hypothetical protein
MNFSTWVGNVRRELTPWFAGADKPGRAGVYQRSLPAGPYSCWDGLHWFQDRASVAVAAVQIRRSRYQEASWRGLVEGSEPQDLPGLTESIGSSLGDVTPEQPS